MNPYMLYGRRQIATGFSSILNALLDNEHMSPKEPTPEPPIKMVAKSNQMIEQLLDALIDLLSLNLITTDPIVLNERVAALKREIMLISDKTELVQGVYWAYQMETAPTEKACDVHRKNGYLKLIQKLVQTNPLVPAVAPPDPYNTIIYMAMDPGKGDDRTVVVQSRLHEQDETVAMDFEGKVDQIQLPPDCYTASAKLAEQESNEHHLSMEGRLNKNPPVEFVVVDEPVECSTCGGFVNNHQHGCPFAGDV